MQARSIHRFFKISGQQFEEKKGICIISTCLPQDINCEEKNSNFTMKEPSRYHLNLVIMVIITSNKIHQYHVSPGKMHWIAHNTFLWYTCQNCNFNLIMKKYQTNFNWETFYKITDHYFSKCQCHERKGNIKKLS